MTFLPVVERELRVAAQRRNSFWTRTLAALVATLVGAWALMIQDWVGGSLAGQQLFRGVALAAFWFGVIAGPVFTADTLSQERRDGTLGLLFLTDLRSYDVVLGKLAASSITAVFSLLAILPVLSLTLLLGGVSLGEFVRVALVLVNTLLFSLAIGMAVSSQCRESGSAAAMTVLVLFLFFVVVPILGEALDSAGGLVAKNVTQWMFPFYALELAFNLQAGTSSQDFWLSLGTIHALGWAALWFATWRARRAFADEPRRRSARRWRERWAVWTFGAAAARRRLRAQLLAGSPLVWLGGRNLLKRRALGGFVILMAAFWVSLPLWLGAEWAAWRTTVFAAYWLHVPLKILMASEASACWLEQRRAGALELLLTTPLTLNEVVRGQQWALRRLFALPVVAVVGAQVMLLAMGWRQEDRDVGAGEAMLVSLIVLVWDLHTLAWVGAWQGLIRRRVGRAFAATLFRVLVLPWMVLLGVLFLGGDGVLRFLPWLWLLICGGVNVMLWWSAWGNLHRRFREVAAQEGLAARPAAT